MVHHVPGEIAEPDSASAATPMLSVQGLSKRFGALQALHDVRFEVPGRGIVALIGPNGSGKTTLFQCVAGVMPADAGDVRCSGDPCDAESRGETLYYLPDGIRPWPAQSVRSALAFVGDLAGASEARRRAVADAMDVTSLRDARLGTLSKGQHKRVLLAMALLQRQPLLMLDEPFDGLDLRQTRDAMEVLRAEAANGRTLFLSIHQLVDAQRICDRFVLLSGGRIAGEGTLDELRSVAREKHGRSDALAGDASLEEVFLALT